MNNDKVHLTKKDLDAEFHDKVCPETSEEFTVDIEFYKEE